MLHANWAKVDKDAVERLIANGVAEGVHLDYKQELHIGTDSEKKEFLADVVSFANAAGGDLVLGVEEQRDPNGRPSGLPLQALGIRGLEEAVKLKLDSMISDGLAPKLSTQLKLIEGFPDGPVLIIRVAKSWAAPHMVAFKGSSRFYSRGNAGKVLLDVHQIRAAFAQSEAVPARIRALRLERVGRIVAGDAPADVNDASAVVSHVVPYGALTPGFEVDLRAVRQAGTLIPPNAYSGQGFGIRFTLDGLVSKGATTGYVQLFRNGVVEMVQAPVSTLRRDDSTVQFWPHEVEKMLLDTFKGLPHHVDLVQKLGCTAPIAILVTIVNVANHVAMLPSSMHMSAHTEHTIDRAQLLLPEIVLETGSESLPGALRPMFDALYQAGNYDRSFSYDASGNWKPPG